MAKLLFSNKAVEDLSEIWNYTAATWSEAQADKYYSLIIEACQRIAGDMTHLGKEYSEIMPGLYGHHTHKHIVFYRQPSAGTVEIIRILHERMDLKTHIIM